MTVASSVVHEGLGRRAEDVNKPIIKYIVNVLSNEDFDFSDDGEGAFDALDELLVGAGCVSDFAECRSVCSIISEKFGKHGLVKAKPTVRSLSAPVRMDDGMDEKVAPKKKVERFYAAASYAGFDGSPRSASKAVRAKFSSESALILYALYQQATVGPCNAPEPSAWHAVEKSKWSSWKKLADMASTEAMRLFVKILEEEDPGWYSRASNFVSEPMVDVQMNQNSSIQPVVENGNSFPETKTISTENGSIVEVQDKGVVSEGFGSVVVYDQWTAPPVSGLHPKSRY
ncbi:hypothetical protein C1H46_008613 [Malus baccata]|uniref:ACB domain-containing protein n=1 Tax=Malus baccata TaxID=106549 RepID=A0A540N447_MALBA|nr:hypothetical protein C1H46_008613 [Malus baccata]